MKQRLEEVEEADDFNVSLKSSTDTRPERVQMNPIVREINILIDRNFEEMNSELITSEFYQLGTIYNSLKEI